MLGEARDFPRRPWLWTQVCVTLQICWGCFSLACGCSLCAPLPGSAFSDNAMVRVHHRRCFFFFFLESLLLNTHQHTIGLTHTPTLNEESQVVSHGGLMGLSGAHGTQVSVCSLWSEQLWQSSSWLLLEGGEVNPMLTSSNFFKRNCKIQIFMWNPNFKMLATDSVKKKNKHCSCQRKHICWLHLAMGCRYVISFLTTKLYYFVSLLLSVNIFC